MLTSSSPRAGRERWGRVACVLCGGRGVEGTLKFLRSFLITLNRFCPRLRAVRGGSLVPLPTEHRRSTQPTRVVPSLLWSLS